MMTEKETKLLYLITDSDFGGTEVSVMRLAEGIRNRGYKIVICSIKKKGHVAETLEEHGIEVRSLNLPSRVGPLYPFFFIFGLIRWRRILREEGPDLIHAFLFQSNLVCALTKTFQRKRDSAWVSISSLRCINEDKPGWRILTDRFVLNRADMVLSVSEAVKETCCRREGIDRKKIRVVYHGVGEEFLREHTNGSSKGSGQGVREGLGLDMGDYIIGTVGRLHRDKGLLTLIQAVVPLKAHIPNIRILIIGDGPEKNRLIRYAERAGIEERVLFKGFQKAVIPWLLAMDIFCLTSMEEGLPQSLLEAMALGRPVIASDVGGIPEVIDDHRSGILIQRDDPSSLCASVRHLYENPKEAHMMGKAAREKIIRGFSLTGTLDRMGEIYDDLLRKRRISGSD